MGGVSVGIANNFFVCVRMRNPAVRKVEGNEDEEHVRVCVCVRVRGRHTHRLSDRPHKWFSCCWDSNATFPILKESHLGFFSERGSQEEQQRKPAGEQTIQP